MFPGVRKRLRSGLVTYIGAITGNQRLPQGVGHTFHEPLECSGINRHRVIQTPSTSPDTSKDAAFGA